MSSFLLSKKFRPYICQDSSEKLWGSVSAEGEKMWGQTDKDQKCQNRSPAFPCMYYDVTQCMGQDLHYIAGHHCVWKSLSIQSWDVKGTAYGWRCLGALIPGEDPWEQQMLFLSRTSKTRHLFTLLSSPRILPASIITALKNKKTKIVPMVTGH